MAAQHTFLRTQKREYTTTVKNKIVYLHFFSTVAIFFAIIFVFFLLLVCAQMSAFIFSKIIIILTERDDMHYVVQFVWPKSAHSDLAKPTTVRQTC